MSVWYGTHVNPRRRVHAPQRSVAVVERVRRTGKAARRHQEADELLERTKRLAKTPHETSTDFVVQALQARLDAGELSMSAAQACMLNGGARAYAEKSNQNRKLRESYFVGVVTPATKHLKKEIARLTS